MSNTKADDLGERLLTVKDVCEKINFSRKFVWKHVREGRFPPPLTIGRNVRWRLSEIDRWIAQLA